MQKEENEANPKLRMTFDFPVYRESVSLLLNFQSIQKVQNKILGTAKKKELVTF